MARRNQLILALLATLVLSVLPIVVDRYEERIDRGPGIKALRNPFLAAERFLDRSGVDARSLRRWQQLDQLGNEVGTLVLSDTRLILSEPQLERVLVWVEEGGNLIVGAPPPADAEQDLLFVRLGLSAHKVEPPQAEPRRKIREVLREIEQRERAGERAVPPAELTPVQFEGEDAPLRAHFAEPRYLHHPALDVSETDEEEQASGDGEEGADVEESADEDVVEEEQADDYETPALIAVAGNEHGPQMLRFNYGLGRVTVVSDSSVWDFRRIGRFDHAYLLYRLVDPARNGLAVRVLFDRAMPSLVSLLRRHAAQPLLAGALLLGAWLWHRGRRFGAAREPLSEGRRALAEHLQASAEYLWRNGQHLRLLDAMRAAVRARQPAVSEAALPAVLAQRSGLGLDAVKEALRERPQTIDEQRFTELSRRLQQLRNCP